MSDVLSQSEIDALLNALSSGESVPETTQEEDTSGQVRVYDFRTANKFYKEQMRTLNVVFDSFAYLLSTKLTGLLHTVCNVEVISVEEQSFGEFNNSLPSPVILAVIEMEPFQGSLLLEVSASLVYALISRLFGGAADQAQTEKSFTEIEISIMENVIHQMMGVLKEAWGKIVDVKPIIKRIENSSQFTQIVAMTEPTAIITMSAVIDNIDGIIALCIPHYSIQPVAKQLSAVNMALAETTKARKPDKRIGESVRDQLDNTYVTLGVTFNETNALLGEILSMRPGDVIRLNHPISDPVNVNVEQLQKFKGVIGTDNHRYAVQIAQILEPEQKGEQASE